MTTAATRPATCLRRAVVRATERPTPRVLRVTLAGPDLADLPLAAPDGYLKMFFPRPDEVAPQVPALDGDDVGGWFRRYLAMPDDVRPPMRTFTLRRRREGPVEFDVDFVLHDEGPARDWALRATPGERVAFTGPYGLYTPRDEHDAVLLAGDETAVPAVAAIVEGLPPGRRATVLAAARDVTEQQAWDTAGNVTVHWTTPDALAGRLRDLELPGVRPYVWLAGEASEVKAMRRHVVRERGVPKGDVCFTGYWRRGRTEEQEVRAAMDGSAPADD
ncbi:siderophore-interacting protein [Actinomycetospora callitridis]|uniref:siderophore-interacting protein n=1 Tax=Actinomycetospora callitridis TaxID=913944 RepID=UPI002366C9BC|nr:siderophore-interacting protein [Actinomycetospora callitridis]MDD7918454.1 siderophore-interacting protein [Actinomycetospora callitridis]